MTRDEVTIEVDRLIKHLGHMMRSAAGGGHAAMDDDGWIKRAALIRGVGTANRAIGRVLNACAEARGVDSSDVLAALPEQLASCIFVMSSLDASGFDDRKPMNPETVEMISLSCSFIAQNLKPCVDQLMLR